MCTSFVLCLNGSIYTMTKFFDDDSRVNCSDWLKPPTHHGSVISRLIYRHTHTTVKGGLVRLVRMFYGLI